MGSKEILAIIFALSAIALLILYFVPFNTIHFGADKGNNFSIIQGNESMQFFPNMRFSNTSISYRIFNCPLQKQDDMEYAFDIMENLTPLEFYPIADNEQISVTCKERNRVINGLFIAGEGGPTNITIAGQFDVITSGEILLIKESDCPKPNVALHELLHVLGFKHSTNPGNIMYNITNCDQTIGQDIISLINSLYSTPSYPDLAIANVSASMTGRFLDVSMTIINGGLGDAGDSKLNVYADKTLIKELYLKPIPIGYQGTITIKNIFITQLNINELDVIIYSNFSELNKENNKIKLEIK